MFYISQITGDICTVVDTRDWVSEHCSVKDIINISKSTRIQGVDGTDIHVFDLEKYVKAAITRDKLHGIDSNYIVNEDGTITLDYLELPREMKYQVLDGTFRIERFHGKATRMSKRAIRSDFEFSIVLPESCKAIGEKAFMYSQVTSINLEHIVSFGEGVFKSCNQLKEVDLSTPKDDKYKADKQWGSDDAYIGQNCFESSGVTRINFGDFKKIPYGCCFRCNELETVTAVNTLEISQSAFSSCANLKTIKLKSGGLRVEIDDGAILDCPNLSEESFAVLKYHNPTIGR